MINRHDKTFRHYHGSALILVVVVTVLLATVGTMFLMVSRLSEMETTAIADARDLDGAVRTVITRIDKVLVDDLFGRNGKLIDADDSDEAWDASGTDDPWLASLEPDAAAGYTWPRITDLWGTIESNPINSLFAQGWVDNDIAMTVSAHDIPVGIIGPSDSTALDPTMPYGARADADGDGVADSRWVKIPGLSTSRGEDVYAAVRIIDNCAMLNLNTAQCFYQGTYADNTSLFKKPWYQDNIAVDPWYNEQTGSGWYPTEINYLSFLRGRDLNGSIYDGSSDGDFWYNLMSAKGFSDTLGTTVLSPQAAYAVVATIEDPPDGFLFFDISDELEIRNRFLLTSPAEARFERNDVANFSLDSGSTNYAALQVPRDNGGNSINIWYERMDPANFDAWTGGPIPYKYDRRHVCTFYSFDRPLRKGEYPLLTQDFADLAVIKGWTEADIEHIRSVFWPAGAVTTNIKNPAVVQPYNNVETRKSILHLLFGLRAYFYNDHGMSERAAALKAAQIVANIIDYADDDAIYPTSTDRQGPFYDDGTANSFIDYGAQANVDCTFINEQIVQNMIEEVSEGSILTDEIPFGLQTDVVFGYERQPFISEVYGYRNPSTGILEQFAVELLNPYQEDLKLYRADDTYNVNEDVWRIRVDDGSVIDYVVGDISRYVPKYDETNQTPGRYVVRSGFSVTVAGGVPFYNLSGLTQISGIADKEIQLLRPAPKNSGVDYIIVDSVPAEKVNDLFLLENRSAVKRQDVGWKFIYSKYELQQEDNANYTHTLGQANNVTVSGLDDGFQLAAADDQNPVARWHDLEVLSLFGNGPDTGEPNDVVTSHVSEAADTGGLLNFNLKDDPSVLDYICTLNRPEKGTLPGRININTAPAVVIAAAIPPSLADPNALTGNPVGYSSLDMAWDIANNRPYSTMGDLLNINRFGQYVSGGAWADENVGAQSIDDDVEEEHWVLSNLANKFTVRSDVFTAYILVRLGPDGPQRRMLAIIDRSNVSTPNDRPEHVALHPAPDPR